MEGVWRSGRKLLLLPCVAAGLEGTQQNFGQLFAKTRMDGSQGGSVQMLFLVSSENMVGRLRGRKLILLVAPGTENAAVTINR